MALSGSRRLRTEVPIEGIMQQQDELGHLAIDDQQELVAVVNADNFEDMEAIEALPAALCQPRNPSIPKSTSTVIDYVGYDSSSLLKVRFRQHSTKLCGVQCYRWWTSLSSAVCGDLIGRTYPVPDWW